MKHFQIIAAVCFSLVSVYGSSADSPIKPGDRIAIVGNTFADQLRIHGYLETSLLQHTRENPVSIRNLGWGGDMLAARDRPTNFPGEASTLTAHKTDVIIACFGMGESFLGTQGIADFRNQLLAFIGSHAGKKYNGESEVRLILVSPIGYEDLGRLTPRTRTRNEDLAAYTAAMREVANSAKVPFVDLFAASRYLMDEEAGPDLTGNGIHLNAYGYWAISKSFCDQLVGTELAAKVTPWRLSVNAATGAVRSDGVKVLDVSATGEGLSFQVKETSTPNLPPPTDAELPPQLQAGRDTLVVENLVPGLYRLTVDGEPVAEVDHKAWSEGVAIDSSPAHKASEAYREAVKDKNLQFTYSWKALNQVHIVGERKKSPSGRALPGEVIEFSNLARERDEALRTGIELQTRRWRLARIRNRSSE